MLSLILWDVELLMWSYQQFKIIIVFVFLLVMRRRIYAFLVQNNTAGLVFSIKSEENELLALLVVGFNFLGVIWKFQTITFNFMDSHFSLYFRGKIRFKNISIHNFQNIQIVAWFCMKMAHIIIFRYFISDP